MTQAADQGYSLLERQLFNECRAMAQYALSQGLTVPLSLLEVLKSHGDDRLGGIFESMPDDNAASEKIKRDRIAQADDDAEAMTESIRYASPSGRDMIRLHSCLARIISPVKPDAAIMMASHTGSRKLFNFLGAVPLIRQMILISFLSLVGMFVVSISPLVNGDPNNFSLLHNNGYSLGLNELFLLFAASIGAAFNALFVADKYARNGLWNTSYETSYWIRYILGLLSGAMLATLIPIEQIDTSTRTGSMNGFGAPILALAGGFSSNMVYLILSRLTETMESLASGGFKEKIAIHEKTSSLRVGEQTARERMMISARLMKLHAQLGASVDQDALRQELDRIQRGLLAPGTSEIFVDEHES